MINLVKDKKVLFITTKNLDYIRNTQEINIIKENSKEYKIIGSKEKSYPKRIVTVYWNILKTSMKNFDLVFIGFAPQLILPIWNFKLKKKKIIIDFFISMYDTLVFDRKKIKENSIFAKILKAIDKKTILLADYIISDTKEHGKYFIEEFGANKNNLNVLYLEADKSIYYEKRIEKPNKVKDKFVVLYFGSILPLQGVEIVLGAVDILKKEKDIFFYVIGPIQKKYNKVESDNVKYIDWLSQQELAKYINFSDLCLAGHFNKNINKARRTIPGKAYIYDAMNKKMILGENPANHELFTETKGKYYFVEMGSSEKLAEKILEIKKEN
ncbi:MAG: group 1 glycosyl transferase [Clostridium sp.]|jgi:glycosyltransferase involved in cell wall biosynthesis|nr:group 1 glycosyl transferase [Clostridium sp.]